MKPYRYVTSSDAIPTTAKQIAIAKNANSWIRPPKMIKLDEKTNATATTTSVDHEALQDLTAQVETLTNILNDHISNTKVEAIKMQSRSFYLSGLFIFS